MDNNEARDLLVDNFFKCVRGEDVEARGDIFTVPQTLNALWMSLGLAVTILIKKTNPDMEQFEQFEAELKQSVQTLWDVFDSAKLEKGGK